MAKFLRFLRKATALGLAISFILIMPVLSTTEEIGSQQEAPASSESAAVKDTDTVSSETETQPEETKPEETQPEETKPEETIPEETQPEETQPEETKPEGEDSEKDKGTEKDTEKEEPDEIPEEEEEHGGRYVPRFFQTDYPDVPYGDGTLATSGCSMTCMAMVVTALTDHTVRPDNLAERFRNADGSHIQRMEAIATIYDIGFTKTFAMYDVVNALKAGKLVVEMVASPSPFSKGQHLILLTGISDEGKIYVNDPMGTNYQNSELNHGLTYGFDPGFLSYGFSGAWIFEPLDIPENVQSNYPGIQLSADEKDILARMVWLEARGEPFEGQQAVAEVVLNRLISDKFPGNSLRAVVFAEDQFSTSKFISETVADELQYKAVERALNGPNVLPTDVFFFARAAVNTNTWGRIGKHTFCGVFP